MYNLETFYPTISTWFRKTYDHLEPAVVYPYPYGSEHPEDVVFDSSYEFPRTVLLLYDQEPIWSRIRWLDHFAEMFRDWGSTVILITAEKYGENLDSSDLLEILNLYNPQKTLERSYKDKISWGYE